MDKTRYYHDGNAIEANDIAYDEQSKPYFKDAQIKSRSEDTTTTVGFAIFQEVDDNGDTVIVEEVHLFSSWDAANESVFVQDYGGKGDVAISTYAEQVMGNTPDDSLTLAMKNKVENYADSVQALVATCLGVAYNGFQGTGLSVTFTTTPLYGDFNNQMSSVATAAIAKWVGIHDRTWWRRGDRVWFWTVAGIDINMIQQRAFMNDRMSSSTCL